ncbi:MAG TPA: hypothetical protein VF521_11175 [Pyrinomonadaceae bacterium]
MSRFLKVSSALLVFCLFAVGSFWLSAAFSSRAQSQTGAAGSEASTYNAGSPRIPQFSRITEKARAARGGDEAAVRGLADEVFDTVVGGNEIAAAATDGLKERVVRSELEYRKGKRKGVDEIEVVKVINGLAKKYGAPDYAKTDQREVRQLRVSMLTTEGDFIARGKNDGKGKKKKKGDSIGSEMSPLEAVYVTADMMKQKMYNEDYQLTQDERRARWAERHSGVTKKCSGADCAKVLDTPRYEEMRAIGRKAAESGADALDTAHHVLDILGIDR